MISDPNIVCASNLYHVHIYPSHQSICYTITLIDDMEDVYEL
jgi:hypothetical protein